MFDPRQKRMVPIETLLPATEALSLVTRRRPG